MPTPTGEEVEERDFQQESEFLQSIFENFDSSIIDAVLKHENARLDELMLKSAKQGDFIVQKKELYTGFYTNLKLILTMSKTAQTQIFHLNAADKSLY